MMYYPLKSYGFTAALFCLSAILAFGQTNAGGTIDGKLSTAKFASLSGIQVVLKKANRPIILDSTVSRSDGAFKFTSVDTGLYRLVFAKQGHVVDSSFAFSIGQLFPNHNKKLLLSFVIDTNFSSIKVKAQKRQFAGSYSEWFTSVPANKMVSMIAEYEPLPQTDEVNLTGTVLSQNFKNMAGVTVTLFDNKDRNINSTLSDENGAYFFKVTPYGISYMVFAQKNVSSKGSYFEVQKGWKVVLKDAYRNR